MPSPYTAVTATIIDPNGVPYANGIYQVDFIPAVGQHGEPLIDDVGRFQQVVLGCMDGNGTLSLSLPANARIYPGSTWVFFITSADRRVSFYYAATIGPAAGAQDLSVALSTVAAAQSDNFERLGAVGADFYVFGAVGDDDNPGNNPNAPLATITEAIARCVSWRGDRVWISPGTYDENIVVDKHGVTFIGAMPSGTTRPDVESATGVALTVSAQGFVCRHMRFVSADDDGVVQEGNGFEYDDCVFDGNAIALMAGLRLRGSAASASMSASEGKVHNSLVRGWVIGIAFDSAAITGAGVGPTDCDIYDNRFYQNTKDITAEKSGAGGVYSMQNMSVRDNRFLDYGKAVYVDFVTNIDGPAASQTGMVANNFFNTVATLDNVMIKTNGTGIAVVAAYSAKGITDASAF